MGEPSHPTSCIGFLKSGPSLLEARGTCKEIRGNGVFSRSIQECRTIGHARVARKTVLAPPSECGSNVKSFSGTRPREHQYDPFWREFWDGKLRRCQPDFGGASADPVRLEVHFLTRLRLRPTRLGFFPRASQAAVGIIGVDGSHQPRIRSRALLVASTALVVASKLKWIRQIV